MEVANIWQTIDSSEHLVKNKIISQIKLKKVPLLCDW